MYKWGCLTYWGGGGGGGGASGKDPLTSEMYKVGQNL